MISRIPPVPLIPLVLSIAAGAGAAADWPQFRGPTGDGISDARGLPLTWGETENIAWKAEVPGLGRSSPVVLGDRIWMTTAVKGPGDAVSLDAVCLDRSSGRLIYRAQVFSIDRPEPVHWLNSHATPTPIAEPGRLYCDFGAPGTAALDADTGRVLWKGRWPVDHQLGAGSSPALHREWLYLVRDGCDVQYVAAVEKATGCLAWKTDRPAIQAEGPAKKSFSTPLVIEVGGQSQVVVPGPHWIVSYEPETGKEVWKVRHGKGYSIAPRPVAGRGMVYFTTGDYVAELWAVRLDGRGDVTGTHVAWKASGQVPLMASPLLVAGELYTVSDNGIVSCLDAESGRLIWRERIGGNFCASPAFADGRIHLFDRDGKATLLGPGRRFERLAENRLEGTVIASPAFTESAIFLRTDTHLYCLRGR